MKRVSFFDEVKRGMFREKVMGKTTYVKSRTCFLLTSYLSACSLLSGRALDDVVAGRRR